MAGLGDWVENGYSGEIQLIDTVELVASGTVNCKLVS
jgi:hypothetical protein